jgi:nucleotide-binding universal stress UspA family protein
MYRKILVPIDGSELSTYTLKEAVRLASGFGPEVQMTVLHVSPYIPVTELSVGLDVGRFRRESAEAVVQAARPVLTGVVFGYEFVTLDGDPTREICETARKGHFELIVMGNRGHGLFTELLLGSVSQKVVQHAHCPVLIIRR